MVVVVMSKRLWLHNFVCNMIFISEDHFEAKYHSFIFLFSEIVLDCA